MFKLSGFTDEAAVSIDDQLGVVRELGWSYFSARGVDGANIHELPEDAFDVVAGKIEDSGIKVAEFGSLIGNWGKPITTDWEVTEAEVERCIPRMKRLDCSFVRVMSYKQEEWGTDQKEQQRFDNLKKITERFSGAGITTVHENCMNWGGFSPEHTLRLIEEVPDMKLVFDIGNPIFQRDRSKPEPYPWQNALEFYNAVKEHVVHVHVKDGIMHDEEGEHEYTMPGKGNADVAAIMSDLKQNNYDGFIAIEPHVATVFHLKGDEKPDWDQCRSSFIEYGREMENLIQAL